MKYGVYTIVPPLIRFSEVVLEVDLNSTSKALIVNDVLFNMKQEGFIGKIIGWLSGSGGDGIIPRISRGFRRFGMSSMEEGKRFYLSIAEKNYSIITVSHGNPITSDCNNIIKKCVSICY